MHYPTTVFDSFGTQQSPLERKNAACNADIYNQPIYAGDNVIEFENGDIVQVGDFREYVDNLPDSELIEFMGGTNKEVKV